VSATPVALLRGLRPAHWTKNLPVLAPVLFGGRAEDPDARAYAAAAFVAFCAVASAGYLGNDVHDAPADRAHPRRRARPVASGDLSPRVALLAAAVLLAAGLALSAALLPLPATAAIGGYAALVCAYTLFLSRTALGVVAVAAGFVLRVLAGAFAVRVPPSPWLVGVTALLALALAVGKRESEEARARGEATRGRRRATDALLLATALGYLLYTQAPDTVALHGTRALGVSAVPVVLALARYRALLRLEREGRGPAEVVAGDLALLALGALWGLACAWVLYG
jgi:decaprenyl-phosphate phosphoribosyltransferase